MTTSHSFHIMQYESVESTQDIAHTLAREGKSNIVVCADQQIAGRGRGGNIWISPTGNLYASLILRPHLSAQHAGQYSFLAAVALRRAMVRFCNEDVLFTQKWPNDVLCQGKKCAGILLEMDMKDDQHINYMIVGLGVNIVAAPDEKAFLNSYADKPFTASEFLNQFLSDFTACITEFNEKGFTFIRAEWLMHAAFQGENIRARLPHETLYGVFEDLDDQGALILRLANGKHRVIHSGDIFLGFD
jgi:BirA family transcriptional regulator, biotin operon repressor / biotin---[acetyl-CoA-carboxylase] ligase